MKKRTKLTICLGVICALLVAISSWYTIAFNNSRFIVPMDLSEYVFRVQDLPMIISGVLLTLYIVNIVVLFLESIKTNRRRDLPDFWDFGLTALTRQFFLLCFSCFSAFSDFSMREKCQILL